jgi:hydrogenase expression/formation protein HypC
VCLGIPGAVVEKYDANGIPMGRVDFGGVMREVCLAYVPEVTVGQYVIVHAGFAISVLDEQEAQETLDLLRQAFDLEAELAAAQ